MGGNVLNKVVVGLKLKDADKWGDKPSFGPDLDEVDKAIEGLTHSALEWHFLKNMEWGDFPDTDDAFFCIKLRKLKGIQDSYSVEELQRLLEDKAVMDEHYLALSRLGVSRAQAALPGLMTCVTYDD